MRVNCETAEEAKQMADKVGDDRASLLRLELVFPCAKGCGNTIMRTGMDLKALGAIRCLCSVCVSDAKRMQR